jgi:hypothetical protein
MARPKIPEKCIRCALLSADTAKSTHDCWVSETCPSKRHYIKNRDRISQSRKKQRIEVVHQVVVPEVIYGNLLIWRELRQDSPIHAIALCALRKESGRIFGMVRSGWLWLRRFIVRGGCRVRFMPMCREL